MIYEGSADAAMNTAASVRAGNCASLRNRLILSPALKLPPVSDDQTVTPPIIGFSTPGMRILPSTS